MKKLVILVSSKGKNLELGKAIEVKSNEMKFSPEVIILDDLKLPLYSTQVEEGGIPSEAVKLTDTIISADTVAVVAPEYNGSMPPCLNNAIAWISRSGENWRDAFNGKPVLIGTHSGGGGAHVLMAMRQQLSYIGANVLGRQLLTNYGKELDPASLEDCLKQL